MELFHRYTAFDSSQSFNLAAFFNVTYIPRTLLSVIACEFCMRQIRPCQLTTKLQLRPFFESNTKSSVIGEMAL